MKDIKVNYYSTIFTIMTSIENKCLHKFITFLAFLYFNKYKLKTFFCFDGRNKMGIILIPLYTFIYFMFFKSITLYGLNFNISENGFVLLLISRSFLDVSSFSLFIRSYYISDDG